MEKERSSSSSGTRKVGVPSIMKKKHPVRENRPGLTNALSARDGETFAAEGEGTARANRSGASDLNIDLRWATQEGPRKTQHTLTSQVE